MLIKLLVAIAILLVMAGPMPISSQSMKDSITDKEIETLITIIDKSIVSYYISHAGNLPSALDQNALVIMGLENIDMSPFSYVKVDANTFRLQGRLSSGNILSANSGTELITINPITE